MGGKQQTTPQELNMASPNQIAVEQVDAAPAPKPSGPGKFSFIMKPAVDRTIAVIACAPFLWQLYHYYRLYGFDTARAFLAIHLLAFVIPMIFRRPPVRVTPNPWFWLLAFVATYWNLLTAGITGRGHPLAPRSITGLLALFGMVIVMIARLKLGRNIGLVPAQRKIVTGGIYDVVRHPIYAGGFVLIFSVMLSSYSPLNTVLFSIGILLFMIKSIVEENFLRADPEYAAYMQRVRWRWCPGIA
jgi:protein-S-isoprenylcysteine O-methyltransferase Ste14